MSIDVVSIGMTEAGTPVLTRLKYNKTDLARVFPVDVIDITDARAFVRTEKERAALLAKLDNLISLVREAPLVTWG